MIKNNSISVFYSALFNVKSRIFTLLFFLPLLIMGCIQSPEAGNNTRDILVGAIRWDAWHTPRFDTLHGEYGGPVKAMERSLSPGQYHFRLPFFGQILSDSVVKIEGYTQEIVDREIEFAASARLDYWAFLLYDPEGPMSQGISLYLTSKHKSKVNFCAIASMDNFAQVSQRGGTQRLLGLIAEDSYQKVNGGRPLLYIFRPDHNQINSFGGKELARETMDRFRENVREAGFGDPYIVLMHYNIDLAAEMAVILGAEAISCYAVTGNGGDHGTPYSELTNAVYNFWESSKNTGAEVVPLVMSGWDRRPRIEHPVPWESSWQKPYEGMEKYFALPTPHELAGHVSDAMSWVRLHHETCPAKAVIIYAWNEHDEGGWLCPTLKEGGGIDNSRLEALGKFLR